MRRWRAVVEYVAKETATAAEVDPVTQHAVAAISIAFDRPRQRIVETRPPGSAFKLHFRNKQRLITSRATERAGTLFIQQSATAGHLGPMLAHNLILIGRENLPPFGFGVGDGILFRHSQCFPRCYLIASGLTGDPTAPVIGMAGATNRNSLTLSCSQSSASSFKLNISPMVMPMIGIVIQCQGWLIPCSLSFGRTSQPHVSLASAANCVSLTKSSVSKENPGASPPGYPSQLPAFWQRAIMPVRTMAVAPRFGSSFRLLRP